MGSGSRHRYVVEGCEVVQDAPIAVLSHTTQLSLPLPLPLSPVVCQFQPQYLDG